MRLSVNNTSFAISYLAQCPILQMKKLRLKRIKKLAKVTISISGVARNLNRDVSPKPFLSIMIYLPAFISSFSTGFYPGAILRNTLIMF